MPDQVLPDPPLPTHPGRSKARAANDRFANAYLTISAVVMVALIVVVVILVLQVSTVASDNHANAVTACQLGNDNRATDEQIFGAILRLPAIASPQFITSANAAVQRAAVAKIEASISSAYAPRNCVALYSTK